VAAGLGGCRVSELRADELDGAVSVSVDGLELARYVVASDDPQGESPRPYLHPVRTRRGEVVTLVRPHDHVWHKGLSFALPVVDDENFWGGATYVRDRGYVDLANNGAQRPRGAVDVRHDGGEVQIAHELAWITQSGHEWFRERRLLRFALLTDDAWGLVFDTRLTNVRGSAISIGSPTTRGRDNAGYGGLFWRGPRSFTGGELVAPDGAGGDELRGSRHPWMGFAGHHDEVDARSLIVMVDPAAPQWFARREEFAALGPAPFFSEETVVAAGGSLALRAAVGVATGGADRAPALAADLTRLLEG
jgi:hypothetical protein